MAKDRNAIEDDDVPAVVDVPISGHEVLAARSPDKAHNGAVYAAIGKRYGIIGRVFNVFSKLRGGMRNNVGLELTAAE